MSEFKDIFPESDADDTHSESGALQGISHDHFMTVVNANYKNYVRRAYGYLKSRSLAEDAVQEGILAAFKKLDTVRDIEALNSWIKKIIARKALDILRKNKRLPDFYGDIEDVVSYNFSGVLNEPFWAETLNPEQHILKQEGLEKLTQCIKELEDIYRIPLLMKDYEGFSIKDISALLEISESNAKVRVHRARTQVKTKLGQYFFPHQSRGDSK